MQRRREALVSQSLSSTCFYSLFGKPKSIASTVKALGARCLRGTETDKNGSRHTATYIDEDGGAVAAGSTSPCRDCNKAGERPQGGCPAAVCANYYDPVFACRGAAAATAMSHQARERLTRHMPVITLNVSLTGLRVLSFSLVCSPFPRFVTWSNSIVE